MFFKLKNARKLSSNNIDLLKNIPQEDIEAARPFLNEYVNTLGILLNSSII